MTGRGGRLTRVALRLGLLLAGAAGAWSAHDAVTGDTAYAADPTPAVTVDLLRGVLSHVLPTTPADGGDFAGTAAPSTGGATAGTPPPAASTRPDPKPPAHPHRTARATPPQRRPAAAPTRPATAPVVGPHGPVRGPVRRGLGPVLRPRHPVPEPLDPAPGLPEPPSVPPAQPPALGTGSPPQADDPTGSPPGQATPTAPAPEHADRAPSAATAPRPGAAVRRWSPREVGNRLRRATHPLRSEADHLPLGPVPGPSSATSSRASHSDVADASATGWTPPAVRGQRYRAARSDGFSSRSPRPGTRPA